MDNRAYFRSEVSFVAGVNETAETILFDAQTSGGLLLAVPTQRLSGLLDSAQAGGQSAWIVGEIIEGEGASVDLEGEPRGACITEASVEYLSD